MFGLTRPRIEAGILYAAVFIAAVVWFEFRSSSLSAEQAVMIPYFPVFYVLVVAGAAVMAGYLSELFLRDPNRWVTLASAALPPVAVLLGSVLVASLGLMIFMHIGVGIIGGTEEDDIWSVIGTTLTALSMCLLFIGVAWPVLLIGLTAATSVLWYRHRQTVGVDEEE